MTATGGAVGGAGEAPTSIIVRTPNWLGDLLLSTAFLQAVLARFPDTTLDLIVRDPDVLQRRIEQHDWFLIEITEKGRVLYEAQQPRVG